ncbi:MAG: hypothetical protein HKN04_05055 [Rhodothermaceae bacterium]|nr:hypothetical protein [Rhodothermaceae bacterium]
MGFDTVFQFEIPYWHPLAVHFPLVLLSLATATAGAYALRGTAVWRIATVLLLLLGAPTAYWAAETGETLEEAVEGEPMVDQLVEYHEAAAHWTVRVSGLALLVALGATLWWRRWQKTHVVADAGGVPQREPWGLRLAVLVPVLLAAALVAYTGHVGGIMVWGVPG